MAEGVGDERKKVAEAAMVAGAIVAVVKVMKERKEKEIR